MWWILASCNMVAGNVITGGFLYVVAAAVAYWDNKAESNTK